MLVNVTGLGPRVAASAMVWAKLKERDWPTLMVPGTGSSHETCVVCAGLAPSVRGEAGVTVHTQPLVAVTEALVISRGSSQSTTRSGCEALQLTVSGPRLVTVRVVLMVCPGATLAGLLLLSPRSAADGAIQ